MDVLGVLIEKHKENSGRLNFQSNFAWTAARAAAIAETDWESFDADLETGVTTEDAADAVLGLFEINEKGTWAF